MSDERPESDEAPQSDSVASGLPDQRVKALVLVSIFSDLLLTAAEYPTRGLGGPLLFLNYLKSALAISQLCLLGVWLGLGEPWWSPRRVLLVSGAILLWFLGFVGPPFNWASLYGLVMFFAFPATAAGGLLIARHWGVRLCHVQTEQSDVFVRSLLPFQFSLRQMFIWTTAVAALITLVMVFLPILGLVLTTGLTALLAASLTWITVWAVLGRFVSWRRFVLCLMPIGLMVMLSLMFGLPSSFPWSTATLFFLHCIFTAGSLAVFRACGYRVGRQMRKAE